MPNLLALGTTRERKTAMDALEVFRTDAAFTDNDQCSAHVEFTHLPSGKKVGMIHIRFHDPVRKINSYVPMPAATHFRAMSSNSTEAQRFKIARLDAATIDAVGCVTLRDGTRLRRLTIEPAISSFQPTRLDYKIVRLTLELAGLPNFDRSIRDHFPPDQHHLVPDKYYADCSKLAGISISVAPAAIKAYLKKQGCDVSRTKISQTLQNFGIRIPSPKPS